MKPFFLSISVLIVVSIFVTGVPVSEAQSVRERLEKARQAGSEWGMGTSPDADQAPAMGEEAQALLDSLQGKGASSDAQVPEPAVDTCRSLPANLNQCQAFQCERSVPGRDEQVIVYRIKGFDGRDCSLEMITLGGTLECSLSFRERKDLVDHFDTFYGQRSASASAAFARLIEEGRCRMDRDGYARPSPRERCLRSVCEGCLDGHPNYSERTGCFQCQSDRDCLKEFYCQDRICQRLDVVQCASNKDCNVSAGKMTHICLEGKCAVLECGKDAQCDPGFVCENYRCVYSQI